MTRRSESVEESVRRLEEMGSTLLVLVRSLMDRLESVEADVREMARWRDGERLEALRLRSAAPPPPPPPPNDPVVIRGL